MFAHHAQLGRDRVWRLIQAVHATSARGVFALALLIGLQFATAMGMVSAQQGVERFQGESPAGHAGPEPEAPDARPELDALKQRRSSPAPTAVMRTPDACATPGFPHTPTARATAAARVYARACAWCGRHRHLPAGDPLRRLQRSHAPPGLTHALT